MLRHVCPLRRKITILVANANDYNKKGILAEDALLNRSFSRSEDDLLCFFAVAYYIDLSFVKAGQLIAAV